MGNTDDRLAGLEASVRRLRRTTAVLAAALVAVIVAGVWLNLPSTVRAVVRARDVQVVDASGSTAIRIVALQDANAAEAFSQAKAAPASLSIGPSGNAAFSISDTSDGGFSLTLMPGFGSLIELRQGGKPTISLSSVGDSGHISVTSPASKAGVLLHAMQDGGGVSVTDANDKTILSATAAAGFTRLTIEDSKTAAGISLGTLGNVGEMHMDNAGGESVVSIGGLLSLVGSGIMTCDGAGKDCRYFPVAPRLQARPR